MHKMLIPLLLVALPIAAQTVYSYKDSNGNTVFTEQPPANVNAKEVRLPKFTENVVSEEDVNTPAPESNQPTEKKAEPIVTGVIIAGLPKEDDGSIRANDGTFSVSIQIQSNGTPLSSYAYQILLDGQPYGTIQSSNSFTLTNIDRGMHTMQAKVFNNGMLIASSNVESFTVQRVATQQWKIQPR